MYSTDDPGLPYGKSTPECSSYKNESREIRQIDISAVIFGIKIPVRQQYRNIVNDHYTSY